MPNIALIDLDGVIADNTERMARATDDNGKIIWSIAFDPELVDLDLHIAETMQYLEILSDRQYHVILLTSRPESMREATWQWLRKHHIIYYGDLVMKPPAAQFIKTITWKASTLDTLAMLFDADHVIFVDDEPANLEEAKKHHDPARFSLATYSSLAKVFEE